MAGSQDQDTHDALCNPAVVEGSMAVRGEYSRDGMVYVGYPPETLSGLRRCLDGRKLDPEDKLESLGLEEVAVVVDMSEAADMGVDGQGLVAVGDGQRTRCKARELGSRPAPVVAYLRFGVEDSCVT